MVMEESKTKWSSTTNLRMPVWTAELHRKFLLLTTFDHSEMKDRLWLSTNTWSDVLLFYLDAIVVGDIGKRGADIDG